MSYTELFKLKSNPFRIIPATRPEEIIWAGFPDLKEKFTQRIKRSLNISNSSIILNWGEFGSGKTHAARYFTRINHTQYHLFYQKAKILFTTCLYR